MRKLLLTVSALALLSTSALAENPKLKARLDHFEGTKYVLAISDVPYEITKITCDGYTLLGLKSWNDQNNFTIPAADNGTVVVVAVINANKYDGWCATEGSLVAHTDSGNFVGHLENGPGTFNSSTKMFFNQK